ncbi:YciI family protein [Arthrobacter crystallopoietes]|jgi:uncharacterized protein|uniref:YciI family protein n=1 Tax=Crystallibacter crystallopoietes TaxID=37928 RepID=UPI00111158AD|nr:YciI family protein [Arthrobacter crystallopoietes]QTG79792.1 hypothetical protein J5251_12800 [Arthrobacter crystallopoietes]
MSVFAVEYVYAADTEEGRDTHRAAHREWLKGFVNEGRLLASGPYADGTGALLLFTAGSEAALLEELKQDPFNVQNFVSGLRVTEWKPVTGAFADYA